MKCVVCNSTRVRKYIKNNKVVFLCKKCGYINKKAIERKPQKTPIYL